MSNTPLYDKKRAYFLYWKVFLLHVFMDGFRYVASSRVICNYGLLAVALNFMLIPINALQAPIAKLERKHIQIIAQKWSERHKMVFTDHYDTKYCFIMVCHCIRR